MLPRNQLILLITVNYRHSTVHRLRKWGIIVPTSYVLYNTFSTKLLNHFLFECGCSTRVWGSFLTWRKTARKIRSREDELHWISNRAHRSGPLAELLGLFYSTSIYHIRRERCSDPFREILPVNKKPNLILVELKRDYQKSYWF